MLCGSQLLMVGMGGILGCISPARGLPHALQTASKHPASTCQKPVKHNWASCDYTVFGLCPVFPESEKHLGLVAATVISSLKLTLSQSIKSQHPHHAHVFLRPSHTLFPEVTAHESPLWGDGLFPTPHPLTVHHCQQSTISSFLLILLQIMYSFMDGYFHQSAGLWLTLITRT